MAKSRSSATLSNPNWQATKHKGTVYALAFSPGGKYLASGGHDARVRLWSMGDGKQVVAESQRQHKWRVSGLAFGPGWGEVILLTESGTKMGEGQFRAYKWDAVQNVAEQLGGESGVRFMLNSLACHPAGTGIAFGERKLMWFDCAAEKWDAELYGHAGTCTAVAFSPNGQYLAAAGIDGVVRVLGEFGKIAQKFAKHKAPATGLAYSTDGTCLAAVGEDGCVRVWNTATGKELAKWTADPGRVLAVAFVADGQLAVAFDVEEKPQVALRIWSVGSSKTVTHLLGGDPTAIAVSADGRLAVGCSTGAVRVWGPEALLSAR